MKTQFGLLDQSYKLTRYGHVPRDDGIAGHIHLAPVGKNGPTIIALGSNAEIVGPCRTEQCSQRNSISSFWSENYTSMCTARHSSLVSCGGN